MGGRRAFLRVGGLALGGLTLPGLLRADAARAAEGTRPSRKSCILVWLAGGPSHIDMYDLKPDAPAEVRGEFKPIDTNVAGIRVGEHLPRQAKIMDKIAVVRSAYHTNAGHGMGSQWMLTGYQPTIEVNDNIYPGRGLRGGETARPQRAGAAGLRQPAADAGLREGGLPRGVVQPVRPGRRPDLPGFQVRNLKLPGGVDADRLGRRRALLAELDGIRRDLDTRGDLQGWTRSTATPWAW